MQREVALDRLPFAWGLGRQMLANYWQGAFPTENLLTMGMSVPRPSVLTRQTGSAFGLKKLWVDRRLHRTFRYSGLAAGS